MSLVQKPFFSAVKGKVVLAFLFAAFALLLAWGVSKFVFGEILGTLEKISAPNDKLRIVNKLSHQIASLDYLQRNPNDKASFRAATNNVRKDLDTLSNLYQSDTKQLQRINALKSLLINRDKQFALYLAVKENLVSTETFSAEIEKLNDLLAKQNRQADSAIFTTQTSTATTTMAPEDERKSKGFLSRLFGKKKAEVYQIINEEYKIKRDTVNPKLQDSVMLNVKTKLKTIENDQRKKSNRFLREEAELATSSGVLTKQMLNVLREVEAEALTQVDRNEFEAKATVDEGIYQIKVIIIVFFVITLILGSLILIDITKNNKYRLALEKAKDEAEYHGKAKQRFLSNMSHEIRTPLQSILGYSEIVSQQEKPDRRYLDAIHQSSTHLLQIVNEVLDYNRIISGEFSFDKKPFNLNKTLDEVIEAMSPLAEKKGLLLITAFNLTNNVWLNGDVFRLKQILYNLIGNAIKFTQKGYVKLIVEGKAKEQDLHCYFTIEDTGVGFAKGDMEKIFNAFEQVANHNHYLINRNGTGLGLSIVKTLVDTQQGRISVKSEEGQGSNFVVYLKFEQNKVDNEVLAQAVKVIDKPKMVWVIDDDRLIIDLCEIIFTNQEIPFKTFGKVEHLMNQPIDDELQYVLIDMRLEGITGLEVFKMLKAKLPLTVKYYAMTAQVLPDERQAVVDAGFEGILMKPFKTEDLLSVFGVLPQTETTPSFDDSFLYKMTMGDEELMAKILKQFVIDCEEDIELLSIYTTAQNLEDTRLVVHRLAGRLGQIGAKDLGISFREMEEGIAGSEFINEALKQDLYVTIKDLQQFIGAVKLKIAAILQVVNQ